MHQQTSFAELEYRNKKLQTRREVFLEKMVTVVPWVDLLACTYYLQLWVNFSDRQMEAALYEIDSVRHFADFASVTDALQDETTILNFRHLLEKHDLPAQLLTRINAHL